MSENTEVSQKKVINWVTAILGVLGVVLYITFTIISISFFPGEFRAIDDYLSVLGNSNLNPAGAIFYNIGIYCAAFLVFIFFLGFGLSKRNDERKKLLITITVVGILNALAIAMSGIFPEAKNYDVHFVSSLSIFITLIPLFILLSIYLLRNGIISKILAISGFVLAVFNTFFVIYVLTIGTSTGSIIEWISVFSYNGWVAVNGINLLINKKSFIRLNTPNKQ